MTKQQCIAYILRMLWMDYAFALCPDEQSMLILKLLVALEEVEGEVKRSRYESLFSVSQN